MDKLKVVFDKQEAFQESLGTIIDNFTEEERASFIMRHSVYMEQEVQEALYEMPFFKDWKDYSSMDEDSRAIAWQKVRMELVDAFHFFVNMCLAAGHTPETLFHMYIAKNKENNRRQEDGYSYDKLYREQSVEDVMSILSSIDNVTPTCAVSNEDGIVFSDDFVAVMCKPDGEAHMFYNADVVTLGLAARLTDAAYYSALEGYSLDEQLRIKEAVEEEPYE